MSDGVKPPDGVSPERLFGILAVAWPSSALNVTLEGFPLSVRAMPASEWAAAQWGADTVPSEVRASRYTRELLSRCLWTGSALALSVEDLGLLADRELRAVSAEALATLDRIAPTYARCDWQAWQAVLERGARHPLNRSTAVSLAACCDYGHGAITWRPDRYLGLPFAEIGDHFWMCYRAARAVCCDDDKPKSIADAIRQAQAGRSG